MATVHDAAKYVMDHLVSDPDGNGVTSWKLQKLVYYCQAWSLVWDERALFPENIEAWADGPVCPELYKKHRGQFNLHAGDIHGDPAALDEDAAETIDAVLKHYGNKTGRYLSDLAHMERPWIEARGDTMPGMRSTAIISHETMAEYYGGL